MKLKNNIEPKEDPSNIRLSFSLGSEDYPKTLEIFDRVTEEVVETKSISSRRSFEAFLFYWAMQCNDKRFGWRIQK